MIEQFGVKLDARSQCGHRRELHELPCRQNFCGEGDIAARPVTLVVWAISEGRKAARAVDTYLMGVSHLA